MPLTLSPPTPEAKLSAYYKTPDKALSQLDAWITIDPEGVTEEDVKRLHQEIVKHLSMTREVFIEPIMILVRGGKA